MKNNLSVLLIVCILFALCGCEKSVVDRDVLTADISAAPSTSVSAVPPESTPLTESDSTICAAPEPKTTAITETTDVKTVPQTTHKETTVQSTVTESKTTDKETTTKAETTTQKETAAAKEKKTRRPRFTLPIFTMPFVNEKPTHEDGSYDYSYFDDSAFVGNSRVMDFGTYGLAKNVYAGVGLTVDTVFTKSRNSRGLKIIDELNGKDFKKVYLMFGDNESGWSNLDIFAQHYKKVIDAVKERCPHAKIYLMAAFPISKSADARNEYGYNMNALRKVNAKIEQLAKNEGVCYITPGDAIKNVEGFLPGEAASDGVHMNKKYCQKCINYLYENT